MTVDHESKTPASQQVAAILREGIRTGKYAPGRRLPSENDLSQQYGIAKMTARKALRILVREGLAEVVIGMGTYVAEGSQDG